MKYLAHISILLGIVLAAVSSARGQYGLYGAPDGYAQNGPYGVPDAQPQNGPYGVPNAYPETAAAPETSQYEYPSTSSDSYYSAKPSDFTTGYDGAAPQASPPAQPPASSAGYTQQSPYSPAAYSAADRYAWRYGNEPSPGDLPSRQVPQLNPNAPQGPSVVTQMLDESPGHGVPSAYPATSSSGCGIDFSCAGEGCATAWKPCWYGSVAWLTLGRDNPNTLWTTYEDGNNANQLSTNVDLEWGNGGEVTIGRTYSCGCWNLEATYWQLSPQEGEVSVTNPNNVSTTFDFADVVYADAALAGLMPVDLFDGAAEHRVWRRSKVHDVELNMIRNRNCGADACMRTWDLDWSIGVRYFHFEEDWAFRSRALGGSWANPATIGNLEDHISNSLVGFQFGLDVNYQCFRKVRLFFRPDFGIYNNRITNRFLAYRSDGQNFAPDPASTVAGSYPVHSSTDKISFLTELDLGLEWQFNPRWTMTAGYRVLVATGIGLAQNQVPPYIVDIPEIASIDDNGELVLHGAFVGLQFTY